MVDRIFNIKNDNKEKNIKSNNLKIFLKQNI